MIVGIGIDVTDIHRFEHWHTYSHTKLCRVFSTDEIKYCMITPTKTSERFAVRYAAKEAFYKTFSTAYPQHNLPFLMICKTVWIYLSKSGVPELQVAWETLQKAPLKRFVSLTHTPTMATALVILEDYSAKAS